MNVAKHTSKHRPWLPATLWLAGSCSTLHGHVVAPPRTALADATARGEFPPSQSSTMPPPPADSTASECESGSPLALADVTRTVLGVWEVDAEHLGVASALGLDLLIEHVDLANGARSPRMHATLPERAVAVSAWKSADGSALVVWQVDAQARLGRLSNAGLQTIPSPGFSWADDYLPPPRESDTTRWIHPLGNHGALYATQLPNAPADFSPRAAARSQPHEPPRDPPASTLRVVDTRTNVASGSVVSLLDSRSPERVYTSSLGDVLVFSRWRLGTTARFEPIEHPALLVAAPMLLSQARDGSLSEVLYQVDLTPSPEDRQCGPCPHGTTAPHELRTALAVTPYGQIASWANGDGSVWFAALSHMLNSRALPTALRTPLTGLLDGLSRGDEALFTVEAHPGNPRERGNDTLLLRLSHERLARAPGTSVSAWHANEATSPTTRASETVLVSAPSALGLRSARLLHLGRDGFATYSLVDRRVRVFRCASSRTLAPPPLRPMTPLAPVEVSEGLLVRHFAPTARPHHFRGNTYFYEDHPGSPWNNTDLWVGIEGAWRLPSSAGTFALVQFARRVLRGPCSDAAEVHWAVLERRASRWHLRSTATLGGPEPRGVLEGVQAYGEDLDGDGSLEFIVRSRITVAVLTWDGRELRMQARAPSHERVVEVTRSSAGDPDWIGAMPTRDDPRCGIPPVLGEPAGQLSVPQRRAQGLLGREAFRWTPRPSRDEVRAEHRRQRRYLGVRPDHFLLTMRGNTLVMLRELGELRRWRPQPPGTPLPEETLQFRTGSATWEPIDLTVP